LHHFPPMWFRRTRMKSSDWMPTWASRTNWSAPRCRSTREDCITSVRVTGRVPQPTRSTHSYDCMCLICGVLLPKLNCTTSMLSAINISTYNYLYFNNNLQGYDTGWVGESTYGLWLYHTHLVQRCLLIRHCRFCLLAICPLVVVLRHPALSASSSVSVTALRWESVNVHVWFLVWV